jgi:hypothetical protein
LRLSPSYSSFASSAFRGSKLLHMKLTDVVTLSLYYYVVVSPA